MILWVAVIGPRLAQSSPRSHPSASGESSGTGVASPDYLTVDRDARVILRPNMFMGWGGWRGIGANLMKGFPRDTCSVETSERDAVL